MSNWTLKIGSAAPVSFSDLGVTAASLSLTTGARDSLSITTHELIDTADAIPPFAKCELRDPEGNLRFTGWLDQAPRRAAAASESKSYTLTGPIRWIDRLSYVDVSSTDPYVVLMKSLVPEARKKIHQQINEIVAYANLAGASVDTLPASSPFTLETPWDFYTNVTALSAIESVLRWCPAVFLVSDGTAALSFRDSLTSTVHPITAILPDATDLDLNPHYDILRSQITIRWVRKIENSFAVETDTSGPTGDGAALSASRNEILTLNVSGQDFWPSSGIAAEYARWACKLHLSCNIAAEGLHWSILPGHRISFGGILSPWAHYDAVVQTIERDLFSERTRITTGPRRHLGLDQLLELARRSATTNQQSGGSGGGEEPATLTRTIQDPDSNPISGASFTVGTQSAASGGSVSLPPGSYTITYIVPPDFTPPAPESVTLEAEGTDTDTVTADYRDRLRLRPADGEGDEEIDLSVSDIPTGKGPVKIREFNINDAGEIKKVLLLGSVPYLAEP